MRALVILGVVGAVSVSAGTALGADQRIPARSQVLKPGKVTQIVAKSPKGTTFPVPAAGGPSDPTSAGASVRWCALNAGTGCQTFSLPASGWEGLGKPAGAKGYKYSGVGDENDPCKVVLLKPKIVKAICKRADLPSPLGAAGLGFQLLLAEDRYCAESSLATGAEVKKNDTKTWKAVKAATPTVCSGPPTSCGNGIQEDPEQCDGSDFGIFVDGCDDVFGGFNPDGDACSGQIQCASDCTIDGSQCACSCEEDFDCLLPEGVLLDCGPAYCTPQVCDPFDLEDCECSIGDQGDIDGACLGSDIVTDPMVLGTCLTTPFPAGFQGETLQSICTGFDGMDEDFPRCDFCDF